MISATVEIDHFVVSQQKQEKEKNFQTFHYLQTDL